MGEGSALAVESLRVLINDNAQKDCFPLGTQARRIAAISLNEEARMWKFFGVLSALLFVGIPVTMQEAQKTDAKVSAAEFVIPPEAAKKENPVKPAAESITRGKRTYGYDCEMCHGKDGDGKGDLADDMKVKPRNYRDPDALKDMTDGELFYIISKGKGEMTGEGDRTKPEAIWDMVNYIRSLAKKGPAAKPKTETP
jgi:mono/diheme cytochrome c family protein